MGSVTIPKWSQHTNCNIQYNVSGVYSVCRSFQITGTLTHTKWCGILRMIIQILRSCRPLSTVPHCTFTRHCLLLAVHYSVSTHSCPLSTLARHCLVFIVHPPFSTVDSSRSIIHCPLYTIHYLLSSIHSVLPTILWSLSAPSFPLHIVHSPLSTFHCPLSTT